MLNDITLFHASSPTNLGIQWNAFLFGFATVLCIILTGELWLSFYQNRTAGKGFVPSGVCRLIDRWSLRVIFADTTPLSTNLILKLIPLENNDFNRFFEHKFWQRRDPVCPWNYKKNCLLRLNPQPRLIPLRPPPILIYDHFSTNFTTITAKFE